MSAKFTAPVQRTLCWHCDRRLYAGGRSYRMVLIDGVPRPVHAFCADGYEPAPEATNA
jgi:hypothetical protein